MLPTDVLTQVPFRKLKFAEAIDQGDLAALDRFYRLFAQPVNVTVAREVMRSGRRDVLDWFLETMPGRPIDQNQQVSFVELFLTSAGHSRWFSHLPLVDYLIERLRQISNQDVVDTTIRQLVFNAYCFNNIPLLKHLVQNGYTPLTNELLRKPLMFDTRYELFVWLADHYNFTDTDLDKAVENGGLKLAQWLHRTYGLACNLVAVEVAAQQGYVEVVRWAFSAFDLFASPALRGLYLSGNVEAHLRLDTLTEVNTNQLVSRGYVTALRWLCENYPEKVTPPTTHAVELAQRRGFKRTVEFVRQWYG